jgi:hypothetical protein
MPKLTERVWWNAYEVNSRTRYTMKVQPKYTMSYIFKGNLRGYYCADSFDYLFRAKVKIYAVDNRRDINALAVAREKETFHQRSDEELSLIPVQLLAETETDAAGNFTIHFADGEKYTGGAFEIDFECSSMPVKFSVKRPPHPKGPFQFHITTHRPMWKESGLLNERRVKVAYWEYAIANKFWCWCLRLFGMYVISGRVVDCKEKIPIKGLKVKAYDVDLIHNDHLGNATTDSKGNFKIFYSEADFSRTVLPRLNIEWLAGPDLYFSVENSSGSVILQEPRSRGHQHDRENVSNCFCIELCVGIDVSVPPPVPVPAFRKAGRIDCQGQMHSAPFESGLTNDHYAFYGMIRLNGTLAQTLGRMPMEYCFEYASDFDEIGFPINWQRLLAPQMVPTNIGYIEKAILVNIPFPHYVYNNRDCYIGDTHVAGAINIPVSADGWIQVPQQTDNPTNPAGSGMFVSNGNQVTIDSATLMPFPSIDLAGLAAGSDATSTGKALPGNVIFALRMIVRQRGDDDTQKEAGVCHRIAINNTPYTGMIHHQEWGAWGPVTECGICMLDVAQLTGDGCSKITDSADIVYTVAHPNVGSISMVLNGPVSAVNLGPIAISPNSFGSIVHNFLAAEAQCAYLVTLTATYLLTTGDSNLPPVQDQIAFCR